jgi:hypothetical protein
LHTLRRATSLAAVLSAIAALLWAAQVPAAAQGANLDLNAHARAEGNRLDDAVALAKVLLPIGGPAQILKVRVDAVGKHAVAGVLLEGGAKHPYGRQAFLGEVEQIAAATLDRSAVEEVDIWAIVPIEVPKGAIVSGPMAVPTSKNVFAVTFPRAERGAIAKVLQVGRDVYFGPAWEATLVAVTEGRAAAMPKPEHSSALRLLAAGPVVRFTAKITAKELSIRLES